MAMLYKAFNVHCTNIAKRDSEFSYLLRVADRLLEIVKEADFTNELSFYDTISQIEEWKHNYQHLFEDS